MPDLFVDGNPINSADPTGLVKWTGSLRSSAITIPFGAGLYRAVLTSECVDGLKAVAKITAVGPAVGVGLEAGFEISNIEVDDGLDILKPSVLDGHFSIRTVGVSLGLLGGYGAYLVNFGGDIQQHGGASGLGHGPSLGLGAGAIAVQGTSTVTSVNYVNCSCEQN